MVNMSIDNVLQHLRRGTPPGHVLLGFDAFIDRICHSPSGLGTGKISAMSELGRRLIDRDENSGLISLNDVEERSGGNTPNTANGLCSMNVDVTCIGAFGRNGIAPVFADIERRSRLVSFADPGICTALEFDQCKLFLADNGELDDLTWEAMITRIGLQTITDMFAEAKLIALLNWGEIKATQRIWEGLLRDVFPKLEPKERMFLFDFSDMSGRHADEIESMTRLLRQFKDFGKVYISVNRNENDALNADVLLEKGMIDVCVLHTAGMAAGYDGSSRQVLATRFAEKPVLLTGAGDSFNAGLILGLLYDLPLRDCLMIANASSSCYVRTGHAPCIDELIHEILLSTDLWM